MDWFFWSTLEELKWQFKTFYFLELREGDGYSSYYLKFFRKQLDSFFGVVSLKLWVEEEKWEPDYFKLGGKLSRNVS